MQHNIADPKADKVAASEFAIDGEIEEGKVAGFVVTLQLGAYTPDMLEFEGCLRADYPAFVPRDLSGAGDWMFGRHELAPIGMAAPKVGTAPN